MNGVRSVTIWQLKSTPVINEKAGPELNNGIGTVDINARRGTGEQTENKPLLLTDRI